jgi:hypothetical protein
VQNRRWFSVFMAAAMVPCIAYGAAQTLSLERMKAL